jgi:hypothetical protein
MDVSQGLTGRWSDTERPVRQRVGGIIRVRGENRSGVARDLEEAEESVDCREESELEEVRLRT